jgi:hypothetical protein
MVAKGACTSYPNANPGFILAAAPAGSVCAAKSEVEGRSFQQLVVSHVCHGSE